MLARLQQYAAPPGAAVVRKATHMLCVLPQQKTVDPKWPGARVLSRLLARRRMKLDELAKKSVSGSLDQGALACFIILDAGIPEFEL